ncbi:MAG TPA: hypothetical protein VKF84_04880 [Candidatus Sulfotelmatobacter sp.]|nr:hypothetical protein [Candidatus Sulfotelmatobacter sp.]
MFRHVALALVLSAALAQPGFAQDSTQNKNLDIRSSVGDLHVGSDADARKTGLPLYPGARLKSDDEKNNNQANLSLLTDAFGMKLVVANYESEDAPGKIIDFYRDKLKKYGKVLECHTHKHGGNVEMHDDDMDSGDEKNADKNDNKNNKIDGSKELKCDENSGPVTELKAGTEDNQHVVAVEPRDAGKGSTFALVYVRTRGKRGEI